MVDVPSPEGSSGSRSWSGPRSRRSSSAPYRAKATEIDRSLEALLSEIERRGSFFLVVTSDHAGQAREHGTDHPEEGKLPLVIGSDRVRLPDIRGKRYEITGLRALLAPVFLGQGR